MTPSQLFFAGCRLDLVGEKLWRGGEPIPLTPRAFALLRYLVIHPYRLLTKDELLDAVWPGLHVSEAVIKVNVAEIRKAIGEPGGAPGGCIETAHRRGYRFCAETRASNLPLPLACLVGRKEALGLLLEYLGEHRLVTLTGPAGSGKTRLALEAAHRLESEVIDGVWWAELAPATEPEHVAAAVAQTLGVREQPGENLARVLRGAMSSRRLLLVLDNCEHQIGPVAELADDLLRHCPGVRVLATSREPLRLAGERLHPVPPLEVPEEEASTDEVDRSTAVQLLRERVEALDPRFSITEDTAGAASLLVRRLDGMPLGIELAAPQVAVLGLDVIAERFQQSLISLENQNRTGDSRHRSLRAALQWSLRLLSEDECRLLARLGVFRGGFGLHAAEAIAGDLGTSVADVLVRLVSRSMVDLMRGAPERRYRLLEAVREMAAELSTPDEARVSRVLHARWVQSVVAAAAPALQSSERPRWLSRLDAERANIRAALRESSAEDDGDLALEIAAGLHWYWFHRGLWSEGRGWLEATLERASPNAAARASGLHALGFLEFVSGEYAGAGEHLIAARDLYRTRGRPGCACAAIAFLAMARLACGERSEAVSLAEEAACGLDLATDPWERAMALINLGNARRAASDLGGAALAYQESEVILRDLDDWWMLAMVFRNQGMLARLQGDLGAAESRLVDSLSLLVEDHELYFLSRGLEELAAVLVDRGEARRAGRLLGAAESMRERIGAPIVSFYRRQYEATLESLRRSGGNENVDTWWSAGRHLAPGAALAEALEGG